MRAVVKPTKQIHAPAALGAVWQIDRADREERQDVLEIVAVRAARALDVEVGARRRGLALERVVLGRRIHVLAHADAAGVGGKDQHLQHEEQRADRVEARREVEEVHARRGYPISARRFQRDRRAPILLDRDAERRFFIGIAERFSSSIVRSRNPKRA